VHAEITKVSSRSSIAVREKSHAVTLETKNAFKPPDAEQLISSEAVVQPPFNSLPQDDLSQKARADLGRIYKELRKDFHSMAKET